MGESPHPPLPVRSWRRFSLRAAFVAVTLLCLFFVYLGRVERQRRIVDQFDAWQMEATYTDRTASACTAVQEYLFGKTPDADPFASSSRPWRRNDYLRDVTRLSDLSHDMYPPHDYEFQELPPGYTLQALPQLPSLSGLYLYRTGLTAADGASIAQCRNLHELSLTFARDDEAVLAEIGAMKTLTYLQLNGNVTDAGIRQLVKLPRLETIVITRPAVTAVGFAELARIPSLKSMTIHDAPYLRGSSLEAFSQLPQLEILILSRTPLADASLAALERFPALQFIELCSCPTGDEGVRHLARCKQLVAISLSDTEITDASIPLLAELPRLEVLRINRCRISKQALKPYKHLPAFANLKGIEDPPADPPTPE